MPHQSRALAMLLTAHALWLHPSAVLSADETAPEPAGDSPAQELKLAIVDAAGQAVPDAWLAGFVHWDDEQETPRLFGLAGEQDARSADQQGEIVLKRKTLDACQEYRQGVLVAYSPDFSEAALVELSTDDVGHTKTVTLAPVISVQGEIGSEELESLDLPLEWAACYAHVGQARPFLCSSKQCRLRLSLPEGEYRLRAYGTARSGGHTQELVATAGTPRQRIISIDLPASRLAHLIGKPAPMLEDAKAWKGDPVELADLRGKVVLLDFWGYWCGPCIGSMPDLFELHDKCAAQGLVIIAVHDDRVESVEDLDQKLEPIIEKEWGGRDFPFRVALDGGGAVPVPGTGKSIMGKITAEYGIRAWPTAIAIDRDGNVVGPVHYHTDEGRQEIQALLDQ